MSLESVFANPPPLVGGADNNDTAISGEEDKLHKESSHNTQPLDTSPDTSGEGSVMAISQHSTTAMEHDVEEGELEEGELDDEDMPPLSMVTEASQLSAAQPNEHIQGTCLVMQEQMKPTEGSELPVDAEKKSPQAHVSGTEESDGENKREKRKKKKKKRKKEDKEKKKKKKRRYVDHDQVQDDYNEYPGQTWPPYGGRSPPGPYDSPYDSGDSVEGRSPSHRRPTRYLDLDNPREHLRDLEERSPPGPYDSPYDSPPGPYDSPSDDEYGPPPKLQRMDSYGNNTMKRGMLNMEDDYLDAGVLANEKPDMLARSRDGQHARTKKKKVPTATLR